MRNKIFLFNRPLRTFLVFLISSALVVFLSFSFTPEYSFGILTARNTQHSHATVSSVRKQSKPTATPTSQPSPLPHYASGIISEDSFNRSSQVHWGHTDNGQPWQEVPGTDNAFTIDHDAGYIAGQGLHYALSQPSVQNMEVDIIGSMSSFQEANLGVIVGKVNNTLWYEAIISSTTFSLLKMASGVSTTLASIPFSANAGTTYDIQCLLFQQQLLARVWFAGGVQPAQWQISTTITTQPQLGFGGIVAVTHTGSVAMINKFSEFVLYALTGFSMKEQVM